MNILTAGSVKLLGGTLVFLCAVALAVSVTAAPGLIDFRNYIPGVVDAPVFRADGTNRLSGTLYLAQLYAGPDEGSLTPWGAAAASFGVGEMAGYLEDYGDPAFLIIGTPFTPGQRISVQVVAFEVSQNLSNYDNMWPPRLWGRSPVFQIVISDSPTPLVGLQSFSLRAAPIDQIRVSGNQVILRWSAGDGTVNYAVETKIGRASCRERG